MTSKQEIIDAMNREHEGTPPPALFSQTATFGQMDACGARWPEANFDAEKMMVLALQPSEMFGFATARIPFDITAEAERLGCDVDRDAAKCADREPIAERFVLDAIPEFEARYLKVTSLDGTLIDNRRAVIDY